ncbi:hypothetical protein BJ508DRAFT_341199 [Ascobolus immersus RN42]|uniref:Uncharacterized protein n=1 Tax=Ascobolus immersus RN42 TaxID=1160509 RepID=A0A3N4HNW4_ASCIM|nr:hypothetical protein BJ508DRAFT_341199 [Ascobolus immersus RN42]
MYGQYFVEIRKNILEENHERRSVITATTKPRLILFGRWRSKRSPDTAVGMLNVEVDVADEEKSTPSTCKASRYLLESFSAILFRSRQPLSHTPTSRHKLSIDLQIFQPSPAAFTVTKPEAWIRLTGQRKKKPKKSSRNPKVPRKVISRHASFKTNTRLHYH